MPPTNEQSPEPAVLFTMTECLPSSFDFLNRYQEIVNEQIKWDDGSTGTIRGKNSVTYMYDGLVEELGEITEEDRVEPDYNRLGAIVSLDDTEQLQPGTVTPTATTRHIKEFGDVSWYLANYLSLFDIPFNRVIEPGIVAWRLDNISTPRSSETFALQNEARFPWIKFSVYKELLPAAAHGVTRQHEGIMFKKQREMRIRDEAALVIASGKFVLSMIHILATRFGTTYEDVLTKNTEKIEKRIREGTVFDKSGGDDR